MMTLELDDETGALIKRLAEQEHIGLAQLVKKSVIEYLSAKKTTLEQETLLTDIIDTLPNLPTFTGDPLDIQKAMRDEWN